MSRYLFILLSSVLSFTSPVAGHGGCDCERGFVRDCDCDRSFSSDSDCDRGCDRGCRRDCDLCRFREFEEELILNQTFDDFTGDNIYMEERAFESNLYNTNRDFRRVGNQSGSCNSCKQSHHAFASAFSDTSQVITADTVTKIQFPVNQAHTPHEIAHPYKGDSTDFLIENTGMYEISWSLILSNPNPDTATVEILANEATLQPTQTESLETPGQKTISGTIIIHLDEDTLLNLAVLSSAGGLVVNSPMFTVNQM